MMHLTRLPALSRAALKTLSALLLLLLLAGCQSVPLHREPVPYSPDSTETVLVSVEYPHPAITVETYENKEYPLIYHLTTISLKEGTLKIVADPLPVSEAQDEYEATAAGIVKSESTLDFAKRTGALVAINATPFAIEGDRSPISTPNRVFTGLVITGGKQLSVPLMQYGALGFTKDGRAFIVDSQTVPLPKDTEFVFGGFWVILKDGDHFDSFKSIQDSRTAVGISEDGMTVFLLSVEGEQPLRSRGLSYYDCAEILLAAGASDAIELDGGGSVSLIIQGKNALSYTTLRKVANSFGFIPVLPLY